MSRKTHTTDTPPHLGSSLLADFQQFCQSPELTGALQNNPVAAQLTQRVTPSSARATPAPELHSSTRTSLCITW